MGTKNELWRLGVLAGIAALVLFALFFQRNEKNEIHSLQKHIEKCAAEKGEESACYKGLAAGLLNRFSLRDLVGMLERVQKNNKRPLFTLQCHSFTHFLAQQQYERVRSIPGVYKDCTQVCDGGCWHGAIEAHFEEKLYSPLKESEVVREINAVCGKKNEYEKSRVYDQCIHGIGHAIMFISEGDIFYSLRLCDTLSSSQDRTFCHSGVFMENASSATVGASHPSRFIDENNPLYPCDSVEEKYKGVCYAFQASYFMILTQGNWEKTINLCSQVPSLYQKNCFLMLGGNLVRIKTENIAAIKNRCNEITDRILRDFCVQGAAISFASIYGGNAMRLSEFCSDVDGENRENCFRQMGNELKGWTSSPEELHRACSSARKSEYVRWCEAALVH